MNIKQAKNGTVCCFSDSIPEELQTDFTKLMGEEMNPTDFVKKYVDENLILAMMQLQALREDDDEEEY